MARFRIQTITSACLVALALSGCATTTAPGAIGADRRQLLLVSSARMNQMAAQAYNEMKGAAQEEDILNKDVALLQRVRAIATRLQPQTSVFRNDAPGWA
jgi:uncharacterized ferredoxin-like protein